MAKKREYTAEERAAYRTQQRQESRDRLEAAARALLTSEGWQRWAQTRATFHDYSFGNCLLIAMQKPDATRVAGFRKWQELERHVRKGEKSIRIMAPMVVGGDKASRRAARNAGPIMQVTSSAKLGTAEGPRVVFRAVSVFDVSQTDGEPLPAQPCEPITGDSHAPYVARLTAYAEGLGLTVEHEPLAEAGGYYEDAKRRIVVSTNIGSANRHVRTLIHELAHAVGVPTYKEHGRAAAEVIVETAAAIVCGAIGLDTSGESVPYIAGWGEKDNLNAVRKYAETVDTIARDIETAIR